VFIVNKWELLGNNITGKYTRSRDSSLYPYIWCVDRVIYMLLYSTYGVYIE